jgi:transcriptional regulator with XRE-family HTH domain
MHVAPDARNGNNPHQVPIEAKSLSLVIERLAERGYAQDDLERVLGLSSGYLSKLRHGRVNASFQLDTLLRLVDEAPKATLASIARRQGVVPPSPISPPTVLGSRRRASPRTRTSLKAPALLVALAPLMKKHAVRWALGGARAVAAHGPVRDTVDVDIFVDDIDRHVLQLVRDLGVPVGLFASDHAAAVPAHHKITEDRLDIHFVTLPPIADALRRPAMRSVFGVQMPVIPARALAAQKLMSPVAKDQADAAALIGFGIVTRGALTSLLEQLAALPMPQDPYARRLFNPQRALAALRTDP